MRLHFGECLVQFLAVSYSLPVSERSDQQRLMQQPGAYPPEDAELRELPWSHINVIHTTDTHGWLAGHLLEPQFSADWGDLISFVEHTREDADFYRDSDVFVVDTGDRRDGNGLSEATKEQGEASLPIFAELDYDLVTVGNHELYKGSSAIQERDLLYEHFGEKYVASNVDILINGNWTPMGHRFRIFNSRNLGLKVLGLGFLFDFGGNDPATTKVLHVEETVKSDWFQYLLHEVLPNIEYVLLIGHLPVRDCPELTAVWRELRKANPEVPIHMFGGHTHIRDYKEYDSQAFALESGRFCESVGFASYNLSSGEFGRAYIDFNKNNFARHLGLEPSDLLTDHGKNVSRRIADIRASLELDEWVAHVPQTYYMDRAPFPSSHSIFSLLQESILPLLGGKSAGRPRFILMNTGAVRFDMFEGAFTKDSGYIVAPFRNKWLYIPQLPRHIAEQVLPIINNQDRVLAARARGPTSGYGTIDDLGNDGDDTIHKPWKFYPMPNAFQTKEDSGHDAVDVVFDSFMGSFVSKALNQIGAGHLFAPKEHGGESVIDLIPTYLNSL